MLYCSFINFAFIEFHLCCADKLKNKMAKNNARNKARETEKCSSRKNNERARNNARCSKNSAL